MTGYMTNTFNEWSNSMLNDSVILVYLYRGEYIVCMDSLYGDQFNFKFFYSTNTNNVLCKNVAGRAIYRDVRFSKRLNHSDLSNRCTYATYGLYAFSKQKHEDMLRELLQDNKIMSDTAIDALVEICVEDYDIDIGLTTESRGLFRRESKLTDLGLRDINARRLNL